MAEILSIVGAGRVGKALGRCLHELGWRVGVVVTRSIPTARAAVRAIGAGHPTDRLTCQLLASDVVLMATPDGVISGVAADLAHLGGQMQTFSGQSVPELAGCVFGIDGSPAALKIARKMIRQMGGVPVRLSGPNKAAYHAAGTIACAHVLALLEAATRLLMAQGFTRRQAARALLPLTRQTLDNLERIGPHAAWTGPMNRGDFSTVQRHAEALSSFPPEFPDAYKAVARLAAAVLSDDSSGLLQKLDGIFGPHPRAAGEKKARKKSSVG